MKESRRSLIKQTVVLAIGLAIYMGYLWYTVLFTARRSLLFTCGVGWITAIAIGSLGLITAVAIGGILYFWHSRSLFLEIEEQEKRRRISKGE